jgi:murein DD-endopeptidase MepM/ murein hydrolase activator NlpD
MNKLLLCCLFLPLKHLSLTSDYGYRIHPITKQYQFHNGIDLKARHDTVYAMSSGVASVGYNDLIGFYVLITDGQFKVVYGHLSALLSAGGPVLAGTPIAITGATGRVTGEHLHLAIKYQEHYLDPLKFLYELIKSQNHE